MSNDITGGLRNLLPGPLDKLRGPYATVADANAAIPNTILKDENGVDRNFREGKFVEIGSKQPYVTYWWKDDYTNEGLVIYNDTSALTKKTIFGKKTPVTATTFFAPRTIFIATPLPFEGYLKKVTIAVISASDLVVKRFSVSSNQLSYVWQKEVTLPVQAGLSTTTLPVPLKFNKGDVIALFCNGQIVYVSEVQWSPLRQTSANNNFTGTATISNQTLYANNLNIQASFEFETQATDVMQRSDLDSALQEDSTVVALKNKLSSVVSQKPSFFNTYTDFPLGAIDAATGLVVTTGSNATRRNSGMLDIPNGVSQLVFDGFNTAYRYQFYDSNSLPIFPSGTTLTNERKFVPIPVGAKKYVVNVYNSSFLGIDYSKLLYGYLDETSFVTPKQLNDYATKGSFPDLSKIQLQTSKCSALIGSVPTDINTWQNFSDGGLVPIVDANGIILLDNVSTLETQAKIRNLMFNLSDQFTVYITMRLIQLNSSYNMDVLSGTSSDGYGETTETGDDNINKSGFSFAIIHPTLDIRPIFSIVKSQDFSTSNKLELWRIVPGNVGMKAGFERVYSGSDLKMNEVFTLEINYALSGSLYNVTIKKDGVMLVNNVSMGMVSNYGGHGSLLFQCKGTAAEPAEYEIKRVALTRVVENGNMLSEIIARLF